MESLDQPGPYVLLMYYSQMRVVGRPGYSMHGVNQGLALLVEVCKDIKLAELDLAGSVFVVVAVETEVDSSNFAIFIQTDLDKWIITKL